ncbi:MAG: hypothetical protein MJ209_07740 [archaeon]|nr:hypothetical protein [archaeon]
MGCSSSLEVQTITETKTIALITKITHGYIKVSLPKNIHYNGEGLFYCGRKFSGYGKIISGSTDGRCGPMDGIPCPECDFILGYYLYASGKMFCDKCSIYLIRITHATLIKIKPEFSKIKCSNCSKKYSTGYLPILVCFNCKFNLCPTCALKKANTSEEFVYPCLETGNFYCGKPYTFGNKCICGYCNGGKIF